jgi:hypothetical protein
VRRAVASYSNYREAEHAVDWLSDQGFPVERIAIVGTGLRYVEQVAGRVTTARAALTGAGQGLLIGLLFALLFGGRRSRGRGRAAARRDSSRTPLTRSGTRAYARRGVERSGPTPRPGPRRMILGR